MPDKILPVLQSVLWLSNLGGFTRGAPIPDPTGINKEKNSTESRRTLFELGNRENQFPKSVVSTRTDRPVTMDPATEKQSFGRRVKGEMPQIPTGRAGAMQ